jgi:hypothetical protein
MNRSEQVGFNQGNQGVARGGVHYGLLDPELDPESYPCALQATIWPIPEY